MWQDLLLVTIGLAVLYYGAEFFVKGCVGLSLRLGLSKLLIGLTVISLATSAPELAVCMRANLSGKEALALGNVIGSNICNLALILGVAALLRPITTHARLLRWDVPLLIGITGIFLWMLRDHTLSQLEGALFCLGICIYIPLAIYLTKKEGDTGALKEAEEEIEAQADAKKQRLLKIILYIAGGLVSLLFGAKWLISGSIGIAEALGISQSVIGLSLVAIGTSLPELATAIVASLRRHGDIVIGGMLGSCLFNLLLIIGITALIKPMPNLPSTLWESLWFMLAITFLIAPLMWIRMRLGRIDAVFLLGIYALYCYRLFI